MDPKRQREFALHVVRTLRAAGYQAYWAGGCVRDQLLGIEPTDYDVASDATPPQIRRVFGRRRTLAIGAAFGVITVLGPKQAGQIEVATFREDDTYRDGRHPESVRYSTPELDAQRRDFTINGLFYDPQRRQVIDYVGGRADLQRGLVRAIGDARARFSEDRLRILRAVRFAATFQFQLEAETQRAVQEMAGGITAVSAERIGGEMQRMLGHSTRADAVRLLHVTGLLAVLIPELEVLATGARDGDPWDETLRVLASLKAPSFPLALAALLHRTGGKALVEQVAARWRLSNEQTRRAAWLVDNYRRIDRATITIWPTLQRLLITDGIGELLALSEAVAGGETEQVAFCRQRLAWPPEKLNPPPLITGRDLIAHGIPPGKSFRWLLTRLRDAQLSGDVQTRDAALQLADRLLAEGPPGHGPTV